MASSWGTRSLCSRLGSSLCCAVATASTERRTEVNQWMGELHDHSWLPQSGRKENSLSQHWTIAQLWVNSLLRPQCGSQKLFAVTGNINDTDSGLVLWSIYRMVTYMCKVQRVSYSLPPLLLLWTRDTFLQLKGSQNNAIYSQVHDVIYSQDSVYVSFYEILWSFKHISSTSSMV